MLVQGLQNVLALSEYILGFSTTKRPERKDVARANEDDFCFERSNLMFVMSDASIHAGQLAEVAPVVEDAAPQFLRPFEISCHWRHILPQTRKA